ncbi:MAG: (d)CMP kinase [Defluviitaleaceae bacterium]|nr:(d)CMP kinase [Defluviitaleaceae bacterium]
MKNIQIAIDGPGGSGKSTIAKRLAQEMDFTYIDTGAMYRAIALHCLDNNIDIKDEKAVISALPDAKIDIKHIDGVQHIFLKNENVSHRIRSPNISQSTSIISTYLPVREMLVKQQQHIAKNTNIVMDGRDIGTVVLPFASHKIFLTAGVDVRVQRRKAELVAKGQTFDEADIEKEIIERDHRDITRTISPLKQAPDAILIDTSNMGIDQVVEKIKEEIKRK